MNTLDAEITSTLDNLDRPDQRGDVSTFVDEHGVERVAIAVDHGGWYGGVSPAEFERGGFSCGARYYFGEDVALLGVEVAR